MKHELRIATHIGKPRLTARMTHKLGGAEPQGISRMGQTVLVSQVDGSKIWLPPSSSVALWGEASEKEQWSLLLDLSKRKPSRSSHLDARYFSSSLYATGAFQAATLVLELRGSECE